MPTYKQAVIILGLALALHGIALNWHLYFELQWFDILMHSLGGFSMAIIGLAIWGTEVEKLTLKEKTNLSSKVIAICFVLGFVALVGIVWEWHEFFMDAYRDWRGIERAPTQPGLFDTMADFFFDLAGGWVAIMLYWRSIK